MAEVADYILRGGTNMLRQDANNKMGLARFLKRVQSGEIEPTQVDATGRIAGGAKRGLNKKKAKGAKAVHKTSKKRKPRKYGFAIEKQQPATAGRRHGRVPFTTNMGGMTGGMTMPLMPFQMSNPMLQRTGFSVIQTTPQRDVSAEHQLAQVLQNTQSIASAVQKPSPALQDLGMIRVNPMAERKTHTGTTSILTQRLAAKPLSIVEEPEEAYYTSPAQTITEVKRRGRKTDLEKSQELGISLDEYKKNKPKRRSAKALSSSTPPAEPSYMMSPSDAEIFQSLNLPTTGGAKRGYNKLFRKV